MITVTQKMKKFGTNQTLNTCGYVFTWLFFAESIIKIVAMGLIISENAYLRDAWNVIDFTIAISGVIEFFSVSNTSIKALRILRVIRPLKSINAMPSMR